MAIFDKTSESSWGNINLCEEKNIILRCEQDSNLRTETVLDFKSNALTTRPSQRLLLRGWTNMLIILRKGVTFPYPPKQSIIFLVVVKNTE